ncbi:MAG: hypothetical protein KBD24_03770 [Candidatus Pacebacteria bacterium]|nr:hypothetical protein [Candidatus Paceibacterota bacterium]
MTKKHGLVAVVGVAVVVIFVVVSWLMLATKQAGIGEDKENISTTVSSVDVVSVSKIPGWQIYSNTQRGFEFQYPHARVALAEPIISDEGNMFLSLLSVNASPSNDANVNAGLRVYVNIPNTGFGVSSLDELVAGSGGSAFISFTGASKEYQWTCQDGFNKGGDAIRICYIQKDDDIYVFDYSDAFRTLFSREEFDMMVRSFVFVK